MTVEQAGTYYLDWACWSNKSMSTFHKAVINQSYSTLASKKYRDKARHLAKVYRETAKALDSPPQGWPDNVAKPVGKVVNDFLADVTALNSIARAAGTSDVTRAYAAYDRVRRSTGAQTARLRLDLPSANSTNDGCKGKGTYPLATSASASTTASASASPSVSASN